MGFAVRRAFVGLMIQTYVQIFAFAALLARVFIPISFVLGGCATGTVVRKPGYGLIAGLYAFCLCDVLRVLGYR